MPAHTIGPGITLDPDVQLISGYVGDRLVATSFAVRSGPVVGVYGVHTDEAVPAAGDRPRDHRRGDRRRRPMGLRGRDPAVERDGPARLRGDGLPADRGHDQLRGAAPPRDLTRLRHRRQAMFERGGAAPNPTGWPHTPQISCRRRAIHGASCVAPWPSLDEVLIRASRRGRGGRSRVAEPAAARRRLRVRASRSASRGRRHRGRRPDHLGPELRGARPARRHRRRHQPRRAWTARRPRRPSTRPTTP